MSFSLISKLNKSVQCLAKQGGAACSIALVTGFSVAGFAGTASAQLQSPEAETNRAAGLTASLQDLRGQAQGGRPLLELECPDFTFADVLSSPDDILLNTCYARQQIEEGNVRGSAATLERILLIAPNRADVRLLYAIVLFRLDSVDEAEREFNRVKETADLPGEIATQVDDYLGEIEDRRKLTRHVVTIGFGTHYDTNRNSAPMSERQFALGTLTEIANEGDRPEEDFGLLGIVSYGITHDPGFENPHELIADMSYVVDDQQNRDDLDLHAFTLEPGVRLRYPGLTVTPRLHYSLLELSREKFFTGYGASVDVGWRNDFANTVYNGVGLNSLLGDMALGAMDMNFRLRYVHEKFSNTFDLQTLTLRTGNKGNADLTGAFNITPEHRVGWGVGYEWKGSARDTGNSNTEVFAYQQWGMSLNHTWALGGGKFLASDISAKSRGYRAPDALVDGGRARHEHPYKFRTTYGLPMTELTNLHWLNPRWSVTNAVRDFLSGSQLSLTGEYLWQNSNLNNFQYKNMRGQALLTRRFEF